MVTRTLTVIRKHAVVSLILIGISLGVMFVSSMFVAVSALLAAIVVGAVVGNTIVLPTRTTVSVSWASKKYLRAGIVLLGFKLSLVSLVDIGVKGVCVLFITVAVTFIGTLLLGQLLKLPRITRMLVATGFSICGASAVAAMSSIVDTKGESEEETAQAVALVTIFGTVAMFLLPALAPLIGLNNVQAGIWVGASVHEVAQVVAAGGMISAAGLAVATVAKLGRVVLLAPLIALVSSTESWRMGSAGDDAVRPPIVPLFVVGFLAAILVRTFLPLGSDILSLLELSANLLLVGAMLGLGTGVNIKKLIETGWRPLILGALSTILAAGTALIAIVLLSV